MHHALEIQEILFNIFGHCRPTPGLPTARRSPSDLPALARTCRAFKEPALDVLWEELHDLSPLVRCIHEASYELSTDSEDVGVPPINSFTGKKYSFSRLLTETEWDVLHGYTRRIRSIVEDFKSRLDWKSFLILSNSPSTEPFFPNLRHLRCEYTDEAAPLLRLPLPSLVSLDLVFKDTFIFQDYLASFPNSSPNIKRLAIRVRLLDDLLIRIEPDHISRWRDLRAVVCPDISFDMEALAHLSCMPALTRLTFKQVVMLSASGSPLLFSSLHHLTSYSASLGTISRLLSRIRLPAITDFAAIINSCPSRQELSSFLTSVQTSIASHTLESLTLDQSVPSMSTHRGPDALFLDLEDLQACMAFSNLRCLKLNIAWNVGLKDGGLLALASAWPRLEHLVINAYSGWNTPGGITLHGLRQLLETCRSLRRIALAVDTRGFTTMPPSLPPPSLGWTLPHTLYIDVLDAVIDAASVPAVAAFFADFVPCTDISFGAWRDGKMVKPQGWEVYKVRWNNVFRWAYRQSAFLNHYMVRQRSSVRSSHISME